MNIVCCVDDKYISHTTTMLTSLILNTKKKTNINIYIVYKKLDTENIRKMVESIKPFGVSVIFKHCRGLDTTNFNKRSYITETAYLKLEIPELLDNIDKVIYIDGDIIINNDIQELWEIDVSDYYLAAALDYNKKFATELGIPDTLYFNSGLMIMNLVKCREKEFRERCLEFLLSPLNPRNTCDQDVLNYATQQNFKKISSEWNYLISNQFLLSKLNYNIPSVIHYSFTPKPWVLFSEVKFKELYWEYRQKTLWANFLEGLGEISEFNFYIFGASKGGSLVLEEIKKLYPNFKIKGFIDNNKHKQNTEFLNLPIISTENLSKDNKTIVIVGSITYFPEIKFQLKNLEYYPLVNISDKFFVYKGIV